MNGTKLPLMVVGKTEKPKCFARATSLPIMYRSEKNAWMNCNLLNEYLLRLDNELISQDKKIIMFLDDCPAHPREFPKLKNQTVQFLSDTSKSQPMKMGVINSLKSHYKNMISDKKIKCSENKVAFRMTILDALHYLKLAWDRVTEATIRNSFRKANFDDESMNDASYNYDIEDEEEIEDFSDDDLPICDNGLTSFESDRDFISQNDDNKIDNDEKIHVTSKEALESFYKLKSFFNQFNPDFLSTLLPVEDELYNAMEKSNKQTKITDFFKKNQVLNHFNLC